MSRSLAMLVAWVFLLSIGMPGWLSAEAHDFDPVRIRIVKNGRFTWNGVVVGNIADLEARFAALAKSDPDPYAKLLGSRNVAYRQVVVVVKLMQKYGVRPGLVGNMRP